MDPIVALVPARSFRTAKSRLGDDAERSEVAREMFEHVVGVVAQAPSIARLVVATDGDDVAAAARRFGAEVLRDEAGATLAQIVDRGLREIAAPAAIVLMADLPMIEVADVERMREAIERVDVVVAPDGAGLGTNALALRLPSAIATQFGNRDSCARHLRVAQGLRVEVVTAPGLAFDVDQPADLERWKAKRASRVSAW